MRRCLPVVIAASLVAGCYTQSYHIETTYDEFDGHTIDRMYGNKLDAGSILTNNPLALNAQRFQSKRGKVSYYLIVEYNSGDWLFIQKGESLVMLIDGERTGLSGDGSYSHRDVLSGGNIREMAWYPTSAETVKRIANASSVRVKVTGSQHFVQRAFDQTNFQHFKEFVAGHLAE